MSRENVERTPLDWAEAPRGRTLDQRVFVRFPSLFRVFHHRFARLRPPRSRIRRMVLRRTLLLGFAAYNRKDFNAVLVAYDRDAVVHVLQSAAPGVEGEYHGHDGLRRFWGLWMDAWSDLQLIPVEMLDFPDKTLVLLHVVARGAGSGAEVQDSSAILFSYSTGGVSRHDEWRRWEDALEAVGLSE